MSRLIVKNLPIKITEAQVREIFGARGNITDIQLKYTSDGKFRQFAFIGFHNKNAANEAIKLFNNSHISTKKITVEPCALLGDNKKPKSWSKYARDSTAYKKSNRKIISSEVKEKTKQMEKKKRKEAKLLEKYKDDPQFEEFIQLHASKVAEALLGFKKTDDEDPIEEEHDKEKSNDEAEEDDSEKLVNQKISDAEYMKSLMKMNDSSEDPPVSKKQRKQEKEPKPKVELFTVKLRNLPYNSKKKALIEFFRPLVPYSIRIPRNVKGIAYMGFKTEKKFKQALLKDRSFIAGKRVSVVEYSQDGNKQDEVVDTKLSKWKSQEEVLKHEEDIAESGRIFIRNLSYTTTEDDIQEMFSKYGPITEINLPIDYTTRKFKGFGVITFLMPEHAVKAYSELDGSIVHGRMLHLLPGKAKDTQEIEDQESSNYKQKKAQKQKSQAGSSHNWNSLFLGHNAVADVITKNYGTSKETVLNPHGEGSAAVRLALGETQIVAEMRKYLEKEGVHLDAFNEVTTKRSKTIILIKNLPADTKLQEIKELFEKYGILGRVIFPPSGITAIVEYLEPTEARKAFTNLAYSKFKHVPLYLEWAPERSLLESDKNKSMHNKNDKTRVMENKVAEESEVAKAEPTIGVVQDKEKEEEDEEPEPDTTLFVKNLNFQTTDDSLHRHFQGCGKIHYATVATKKDKNDATNILSMGYGFVRFILKSSADKALKTLQSSTLDGKTLELKRSERTLQNDVQSAKKKSKATKQTGTKILVRNVPFQANQREITELFKTFGEIKALRLPKKMSGNSNNAHRGFAFVEYFSTVDAKKGFDALYHSTHTYIRETACSGMGSFQ